jgi:hypothetical protein
MAAAGKRPGKRAPYALLLLALLLTIVLALQIVLVERETLAKYPAWRPTLGRLCLIAGCQLSSWRKPEAFVTVQQSIEADPDQEETLIVQLSFRNSASWPQPWPQIELALTDITGNVIGLRRFRPKDYVNNSRNAVIKPNQTVSVEIAIQEPPGKAAGFEFDFH